MNLSGLPVIYGIDPYSEETSPSHSLGAIGFTDDGRRFRYAKFGAGLAAGELLQSQAEDTGEESCLVATTAAGATSITTADSLTVTANEYAEGYIIVTGEAGTGAGCIYKIKSHPAATSATVTFKLYDPVKVTLTASIVDIVPNPYDSVIQNPASASSAPIGVAVIAGTSGSYGWIQVGGPGVVKADAGGAITVGDQLVASNQTAGCCENGADATDAQALVGVAIAGIAQAEFGYAKLMLD